MIETDFITANRILFGVGKINQLPQLIEPFGKRALVVRGGGASHGKKFYDLLKTTGLALTDFPVKHEPDLDAIDQAVSLARKSKCEFVLGFGGGSVIDTGKAVAALLNNAGDLLDYLEVVGKGLPLKNLSKPYIAIPTTAGTGSEVTKNAVISVPDKKVKVSMRSNTMLPAIALVDPEFTYDLPPELTAVTGMDAFIQVIEPYVCNSPNPMVDMFCRDAIPRAARHLLRAYKNGQNQTARENMAWVSLMGGLSLANAKLGAVHGFAGPIGGMFNAPHGAVCAALLPSVMKVNCELISDQYGYEDIHNRYLDIARWVTGDKTASINDGVEWFNQLGDELKIPKLSDFGIHKNDFTAIIEKAERSSSMKGNPVSLTRTDLARILELAH